MKGKPYTPEEKTRILRQADDGKKITDVRRDGSRNQKLLRRCRMTRNLAEYISSREPRPRAENYFGLRQTSLCVSFSKGITSFPINLMEFSA